MAETKAEARARRERDSIAYDASQASLTKCNEIAREDAHKQYATNEAVVEAATSAVKRALSGGFASRQARAARE